jgi:hypothetical protein
VSQLYVDSAIVVVKCKTVLTGTFTQIDSQNLEHIVQLEVVLLLLLLVKT